MVPLLFVGSAANADLVQQYVVHYPQHQNQQILSIQAPVASPPPPAHSLRRESRSIHQMHHQSVSSQPPPGQLPATAPQQMGPPGGSQSGPPPQFVTQTYQLPTVSRSGLQLSHPPPRTNLPRISTAELQIQQIHPNVPVQMPMGPPPQGPAQQETAAPATQNIFFHHWVPPSQATSSGGGGEGRGNGGGGGGAGNATSPQRTLDSPFTHQPPTNPLTGSEYGNSPKKRKMTISGPAPRPEPPISQPFSPTSSSPATSTPSTSRTRSRGHSRNRSDSNPGGRVVFEPYSRPMTRQRRSVGSGDAPSNLGGQAQYQNDMGGRGGGGGADSCL